MAKHLLKILYLNGEKWENKKRAVPTKGGSFLHIYI